MGFEAKDIQADYSKTGNADERAPRPTKLISMRFRKSRDTALTLNELQRRYVDEVKQRIVSGNYCLQHEPCPCGDDSGTIISQVDRYGLPLDTVVCNNCGTLRFDPYLAPDSLADFYISFYQDMYARVTDPEVYFARQASYGRRLLAWAQPWLMKDALVIEIGCGAGGALSTFKAAGYQVAGCDYAEPLLQLGRAKGLEDLHFGDIGTLIEKLGTERKADLVFLHHVFEHVTAPAELLEQAKQLLSDRGLVVVAVPDVTRIEGFPFPAGNLRYFLHIAHKFNYTNKCLQLLARQVGMQASPVDIEQSQAAPELWVAFGRTPQAPAVYDAASPSSGDAVFRYLRRIEVQFIRDEVLRRLKRRFK